MSLRNQRLEFPERGAARLPARLTALVALALTVAAGAFSACSHQAAPAHDGTGGAGTGGAPGRDASSEGETAPVEDASPGDVPAPVVDADAAPSDVPTPTVDSTDTAPVDLADADAALADASLADAPRQPTDAGVPPGCPGVLGFPGPPAAEVHGSPAPLASGDLNGDGIPDVVVSDLGGDNLIEVLLGRGNGTFAGAVTYQLDDTVSGRPVLGDVDGDGERDVVVATTMGARVLLNTGDGRLSLSADHPTTVYPTALGLADLDGDGHLDLVAGTAWNQKLSVLFGRGDGRFVPGAEYPVVALEFRLQVIDVNGDARPDILVSQTADLSSQNSGVGVMMNLGNGTFAPAVVYPEDTGDMIVADLNGDGRADLVTSESYDDHVNVRLNRGDGTFGASVPYPAGAAASGLSTGDLNGDGKIDLLVSNGAAGGTSGAILNILLGHGDGTLSSSVEYRAAAFISDIVLADVNADSRADLLATNQLSHDLTVLLSRADGSGSLLGPRSFASEHLPVALTAQDLDRDGKPDLVVSNAGSNSVSVFLGLGDGSLAPAVNYPVGMTPASLVLADLTGDGAPDIAVAANEPAGKEVRVLVNAGNGTFGGPLVYPAGSYTLGLAAADLNGDGRVDLAVADYAKGAVQILLNQESGGLAAPIEYDAGGIGTTWLVATDVDGDGKADIVVSREGGVSVLLNTGRGALSAAVTYPVGGVGNGLIAAADLNGDGRIDLAIPDGVSDVVNLLLNDGAGGFAPPVGYPTGPYPFSVAISDLDGDGQPDLMVGHLEYVWDYVGVLLNRGDGTFGAVTRYRGGSTDTRNLVAIDLDGDGRTDVAALNRDRDQVTVLLNRCLP